MRKTVSFAAAVGALLVGFAVPASAATPAVPSYYSSWEDCMSAMSDVIAATGKNDYQCAKTVGTAVPGQWVLVEGLLGG